MRIVVGMHPDQAALARLGLGARLRLADGLAVEQHLRAMRLGRRHLHERRRHRHHDGRGDAEARRVIGDRLGVVAGRHGDDAARPLGRRQRGELGARAALLERVGDLEIFVFDEDLGAGQRRQPRRRQHRRAQHMAGDDAPRGFDVGQAYGQGSLLELSSIAVNLVRIPPPASCDAVASCNGRFCPFPCAPMGLCESWPPANPGASACRSNSSRTPTTRSPIPNCSRAWWRAAWSRS